MFKKGLVALISLLALSINSCAPSKLLPLSFSTHKNHYALYGDPRKPNAEWTWIDKSGKTHKIKKTTSKTGFCYKVDVYEKNQLTKIYNINFTQISEFTYKTHATAEEVRTKETREYHKFTDVKEKLGKGFFPDDFLFQK